MTDNQSTVSAGAVSKVLHLRSSSGFFGAESVIVTLLKSLPRHGYAPTLAVIQNYLNDNKELIETARAHGIDCVEVPCRSRWDRATAAFTKGLIAERGFDLIHCHDVKSELYGLLAARKQEVFTVTTLHGWISFTRKMKLYKFFEFQLLRFFDARVAVAPSVLEKLIDAGFDADTTRVIPNGVDTERFRPDRVAGDREPRAFPSDSFVFVCVGRLSAEKGQDTLLRAFAKLDDQKDNARLLIVGDGPCRPDLEALTDELAIADRVHFAGARSDVEFLLPEANCYVLPSLTEGMPMAVLEAMAAGTPVVATRVGSVPEVLDGCAAALVDPGDVAGLAGAMAGALAGDIDLDLLANASRQRVVERYSAERQVAQYAQLYSSLLDD